MSRRTPQDAGFVAERPCGVSHHVSCTDGCFPEVVARLGRSLGKTNPCHGRSTLI